MYQEEAVYSYVKDVETLEKVISYFTKILNRDGFLSLGVDTETTAFEPIDGNLRLIQISDGQKTAVIDRFELLRREGFAHFIGQPDLLNPEIHKSFYIFKGLKKLLEDKRVKKSIHNGKFEEKWLSVACDIYVDPLFDTFLAAQLLDYNSEKDPEKGHKLGLVLKRYLDVEINKDEQASDWSGDLTEKQLQYAANDAHFLPRLRTVMTQELINSKMTKTAQLEFEAVRPIAHTELAGLKVNREVYTPLIQDILILRDKAREALQEVLRETSDTKGIQHNLFGEPDINYADVLITSPVKITKSFRKLGVPVFNTKEGAVIKDIIKTGLTKNAKERIKATFASEQDRELVKKCVLEETPYATSTGEKALKSLLPHYPILKLLFDFRKTETLIKNYGESFLVFLKEREPGHERVYTSFHQIGAPTGRMASVKPNVQKIPDKPIKIAGVEYKMQLRKAFDFPKGYVGINADYSQIELRVLADMTGDEAFMDAFISGKDLHSDTAAKVFRVSYEDVHLKFFDEAGTIINPNYEIYQKRYRKPAKNMNFAIAYGTSAIGLASMVEDISVEEAQEMLDAYARAYPKLWAWLTNKANETVRTLQARTMSGRRQVFTKPSLDEWGKPNRSEVGLIGRNGRNMPIQGTSADILKRALKLLWEALKGYDARIVNIVHDEIMVEVHESQAEEVRLIVEKAMKEAATEFIKKVPIEVDAKIVHNWAGK